MLTRITIIIFSLNTYIALSTLHQTLDKHALKVVKRAFQGQRLACELTLKRAKARRIIKNIFLAWGKVPNISKRP